MRWLCLLGVLLCTSQVFADIDNSSFGPIEVADSFPLARLHTSLRPSTASVLAPGALRVATRLNFTNTINRKEAAYLIDVEERVFEIDARYGVHPGLEIGFRLPVVYRGGGFLDSPIFRWHDFFGMPQGPRDDPDIEDDEYRISGVRSDGERFRLSRSGTYLGDLELHSKISLLEESASIPMLSFGTQLRLPTGAKEFGQGSLDLLLSLLSEKTFSSISVYAGLAYGFFLDDSIGGIDYEQHHGSGFLSFEYRVFEDTALHLGIYASSRIVDGIRRFPGYQLYLDTGVSQRFSESVIGELLVRENPAPDKGTADFTLQFGLRFDLHT